MHATSNYTKGIYTSSLSVGATLQQRSSYGSWRLERVTGARVGKTYYADDLPNSVALHEGGLYGKVVSNNTQRAHLQEDFVTKDLWGNKGYAKFDAYLVVRWELSRVLDTPLHRYYEDGDIIYPGRTATLTLQENQEIIKTKSVAIEYGLKIAREWGASAEIPIEGLKLGVSSKTTVESSITKTYGYSETLTEEKTRSRSETLTNNTKKDLKYYWQKRVDLKPYQTQIFKVEYQRDEWKNNWLDQTTYYDYHNLGRMRLVDQYMTWDFASLNSSGVALDEYVRDEDSNNWVINSKSQDPNVWRV
jgi:hypothetical protein